MIHNSIPFWKSVTETVLALIALGDLFSVQFLLGVAWNFSFNVKFYPPDPAQLSEDITRSMQFIALQSQKHSYWEFFRELLTLLLWHCISNLLH